MSQLDELRKIFVAKVDDELRAENEEQIREWEQSLFHNEALLSWKEHAITQEFIRQARESYVQLSMQIMDKRHSDAIRQEMWAKQEAMLWLIRLASDDPKSELERIQNDIRIALNATN